MFLAQHKTNLKKKEKSGPLRNVKLERLTTRTQMSQPTRKADQICIEPRA